jgi:hypothetical protein
MTALLRVRAAGCLAWILAFGMAACQQDGPRAARWKARSGTRAMVPVQWNQLWMAGGSEDDTTVMMPAGHVADSGLVLVAEPGVHRVTALRVEDGSVAWRVSGPGGGPQELRNPVAVAFDPRGGAVVLDQGNGRLVVLDRAGRARRHVTLQDNGYPLGVCPLADGSFLLATVGSTHPLAHVSAEGETLARLPLPWSDLRNVGTLPQQGLVAADPRAGGCVYGLQFGRGFARFADGRFGPPGDYVEAFDLPRSTQRPDSGGRSERLGERIEAARAITADHQTIAVGFVGRSDDGGRLIHLYSAEHGSYSRSFLAPFWFDRFARTGDVYVFATRRNGYPALVAARVSEARADGITR